MKDHYAALGVSPSADEEVIAAAYRALAKKFHPDTGTHRGTASTERFREIQEAYEVLGNSKTRAEYDRKKSKTKDEEATSSATGQDQKSESSNDQTKGPETAGTTTSERRRANPEFLSRLALFAAVASLAVSAYILSGEHLKTLSLSTDNGLLSTKSDLPNQSDYDNRTTAPQKTEKLISDRIITDKEIVDVDASIPRVLAPTSPHKIPVAIDKAVEGPNIGNSDVAKPVTLVAPSSTQPINIPIKPSRTVIDSVKLTVAKPRPKPVIYPDSNFPSE